MDPHGLASILASGSGIKPFLGDHFLFCRAQLRCRSNMGATVNQSIHKLEAMQCRGRGQRVFADKLCRDVDKMLVEPLGETARPPEPEREDAKRASREQSNAAKVFPSILDIVFE